MTGRILGLLGLALLAAGCVTASGSPSSSSAPSTRCLGQPGRGQNYAADRPLVYLFCVESP